MQHTCRLKYMWYRQAPAFPEWSCVAASCQSEIDVWVEPGIDGRPGGYNLVRNHPVNI